MFFESAVQDGLWSWPCCDPGWPEFAFALKADDMFLAGMSGRVWYA
ncbi:MAG: hypothetical protein ACOCVE_03625 [Desulfovermiculus sp.]